MRLRLVVASALVGALGCGGASRAVKTPLHASALSERDAPIDLADDNDLQTARDRYDLIAVGDAARAGERAALITAYRGRIELALGDNDRDAAYAALRDLLSLWAPRELADRDALARELAALRPTLQRLRASYARTGGELEFATATFALWIIDPTLGPELEGELEAMFAYADDLAVARFGEGAERARPIKILEHVIEAFPVAPAVDRLVALYLERQRAITALWQHGNPDIRVVQAHGDSMFRTGWNVVRVLVRAGRLDEAHAAIADLSGLGDAPELRQALVNVRAPAASPGDWLALTSMYLDPDPDKADLAAAFELATAGVRAFPGDGELAQLAASIATEDEHLPLAIHYTERAHANAPDDRDIAEELARLYEIRISSLALAERAYAALEHLEKLERFLAVAAKRWPDEPLERDLASAYATMGRGLLSQGELSLAVGYLERSLKLRPSHLAFEHLGTVHFKQGRYREAIAPFERAMKLPIKSPEHRFSRGRMARMMGEAYDRLDRPAQARNAWGEGLSDWHKALTRFELPPRFQAEVFTESGRLMWSLGERDDARRAFDAAVDADPDAPSAYPDIVAFLIVRGEYSDALDAYHRALGAAEVGPYFKVYMSLWVLAEARRAGKPDDPAARDYLASRKGPLWHDQLARFAVGKVGRDSLRQLATTRGRKAELDFYAAMLSVVRDDPERASAMLERVLASGMVLFFEYDMAAYILRNGLIESSAAARASSK